MALDPKNFRPEVIAGSTAGALSGTAPVAGGAVAVTLGDSTTPSVLVGSGVPTFLATKGSLYLRTDGSSVSTRAYIAVDGVGTWTAITTVA